MRRRNLAAMAGLLLVMGSTFPAKAAESMKNFDYKVYADTYPDLKAAFGYDAAALYNHYQQYGKAEGRTVVFTDGAQQNVESMENFDYKAYADTYPDLKAAFGYDAAALYNHYQQHGKAEGRTAIFAGKTQQVQQTQTQQPQQAQSTQVQQSQPAAAGAEKLDPLPPLDPAKMPDWFDARTLPENMTNARLRAECDALISYIEANDLSYEAPLFRKEELLREISLRLSWYDHYEEYRDAFGEEAAEGIKNNPIYQRAAASDITPLR